MPRVSSVAAQQQANDAGGVPSAAGAVPRLVASDWESVVHALQVGLVDPREGLDDDGAAAQVARLQCSVLPGGALPVVVVTDHHPRLACRLQRRPIWCECVVLPW